MKKERSLTKTYIFFLIVLLANMGWMRLMQNDLAAASLRLPEGWESDQPVLCLQFATKAEDFGKIIDSIQTSPGGLNAIRNSVHLDFVYIILYWVLFLWSVRVLRLYHENLKPPRWLFIVLTVPALLDLSENIFMLHYLQDGHPAEISIFYIIIVRLKWILALFCLPAPLMAIGEMLRMAVSTVVSGVRRRVRGA